MQLFTLSHAAADRHPRPDTRDGLCPVEDTAAGEHLVSRARARACHLPKAPFPSAPSTPSLPRESLGDARPGSLTDASSYCRTSPTARRPLFRRERLAGLWTLFGVRLFPVTRPTVRVGDLINRVRAEGCYQLRGWPVARETRKRIEGRGCGV
jgi:hypothetical protein